MFYITEIFSGGVWFAVGMAEKAKEFVVGEGEINKEIYLKMEASIIIFSMKLLTTFLAFLLMACTISKNQMDYSKIAKEIIELQNADLELRDKLIQNGQLSEGYNKEMEALHNRHAENLNNIINKIGYPTIEKVGKEASDAAWLVIQHSIGQPEFMKKCAVLLEKAVAENQADAKHLAYLTDRIAVFEGRAHLYGTQFDWDENGEMNPQPFDDLEKVNFRRKTIGLNSLEQQTEIIRKQIIAENQKPPADRKERTKQADEWRKKVGWIKISTNG